MAVLNRSLFGTNHRRRLSACALLLVCHATMFAASTDDAELPVPTDFRAVSRQLRVDLSWTANVPSRYEIQRGPSAEGPFETLDSDFPDRPFQSDFIGKAGGVFFYRVRAFFPAEQRGHPKLSAWSKTQSGSPTGAESEQLLTEVQEAGFRYFYDYAHPVSGMAREGYRRDPEICTTGATGMGLFNLVVGIERHFITREQAVNRVLKLLTFLNEKADRFHGTFPHWVNGTTGKTIPFSTFDDGADLVETAFLMQGVILAREYFSSKVDSREIQIRAIANELWRGVEWNWFAQGDNDASGLLWHWSPNYGWKKNLKIHGFNEAQSVYLLALASPTHPIQAKRYWNGWQSADYSLRREELGVPVELGRGLGPSLFCTHYSYLGFDPKQLSSGSKNYFEHFQDLCRVQIRYAESKQKERAGYGSMWGITASYGPDGYSDFAPGKKDNGTLAPTAALSSMPYVPAESRSCLAEMYNKHGKELWGPFGFCDSFNLQRNWVANDILGIDVGPIAPMIENYRTGFCWKTFMAAPEFQPLLKTLSMPPAATLK